MKKWEYTLKPLVEEYEKDTEPVLLIARDYFNEIQGKISKQYNIVNMNNDEIPEGDGNLYEVIKQKKEYCYKYFVDIDRGNIDIKDIPKYDKHLEKFLKNTKKIIKDKFKYEYEEDKVVILDANREHQGKYKYSKHIIFPIYLDELHHIYHLFTYLNNYYLGEQYGLSVEIISTLDNRVYIRRKDSTRLFRLIGNSKMGVDNSILKGEYAIKDTLITQFSREDKKFIDIEVVVEKLNKRVQKRNGGQDEYKRYKESGYVEYDKYDILNLPIKKKDLPKSGKKKGEVFKDDFNTPSELLSYYNKYGYSDKTDIQIYLSVIQNTNKKRLDYTIWLKIGMICKKYEVDYIVFEDFTTKAYDIDEEEEVKYKCKAIWDKINKDEIKLSIYYLIDLAKLFKPDIYVFMRFAYQFNNKYNIDKTGGGKWDKVVLEKGEELDIAKYYKEGYSNIICDAGVGYGKTNECIKLIADIIDKDIFVIAFSNRRIFSTEASAKYKSSLKDYGVYDYNEKENKSYKGNLSGYKLLVVSYESLLKYKERILERIKNNKLIMIFDENETLIKNLTQDILQQKYNTADLLLELWLKSSLNIVLDAYMSTNSINFIKEMNSITNRENDKVVFIDTENYNKYPKTFTIKGVKMVNPETNELVNKIVDEIVAVFNSGIDTSVFLYCEEAGLIEIIKNGVLKRYNLNPDEMLITTGEAEKFRTDEERERVLEYFKDTNKFDKIRFWACNSQVVNGISIETKKFTKAIVFYSIYNINPNEKPQVGMYGNDILNGLARARLNNEWDIYILLKESKMSLFAKMVNNNNTTKLSIKAKLNEIYEERKELNKRRQDADMKCIAEKNILGNNEFNELQDKFEKLQHHLSQYEIYNQRERGDNIEFVLNKSILGDYTIKEEIIAFTIKKEEYCLFKELDMLNVLARTNRMYECILIGINKSNKLNSIYKQYAFIELAKLKGNIVIDESDKFDNTTEEVNTRTLNVDCMNNLTIDSVDIRTNMIYKYWGRTDTAETLIYMSKSNCEWKLIDNLIAVAYKKIAINKYDPVYLLQVLKVLDLELYELPETYSTDDIKDEKLYDKTKNIFDAYKKANDIKVLKEATEAYKPSSFIRDLNNILAPVRFKYEKKGSKNRFVYELQYPKMERTLIKDGVEKPVLLLYPDLLYIFEKKYEDLQAGKKLKFIDDE